MTEEQRIKATAEEIASIRTGDDWRKVTSCGGMCWDILHDDDREARQRSIHAGA
jgi:hypothetical protein